MIFYQKKTPDILLWAAAQPRSVAKACGTLRDSARPPRTWRRPNGAVSVRGVQWQNWEFHGKKWRFHGVFQGFHRKKTDLILYIYRVTDISWEESWKNGDLLEFIEKHEKFIWIYQKVSGQLIVINAKNQVATWPQQMLGSMVSFRLQIMIPTAYGP